MYGGTIAHGYFTLSLVTRALSRERDADYTDQSAVSYDHQPGAYGLNRVGSFSGAVSPVGR